MSDGRVESEAMRGRLHTCPGPPPYEPALGAGTHALGLGGARDGALRVPAGYDPAQPVPLVLLLHGAGGDGRGTLPILAEAADRHGVLLLAPDARSRRTWDLIEGDDYGPDIAFIGRALAHVLARHAVNEARIAVAGFSDGASYALSIGLMNGDLLRDVLAFSPGFAAPASQVGRPRIFISHGDRDDVLPIERCGRPLARTLMAAGYDVDYREFSGGHWVPPELADAALARALQ